MVIGSMFASLTEELNVQSQQSFVKAIQYINEAELIQRDLILRQQVERDNPRSRFFQIDQDQIVEDQFILAFRHYTRGVIALNFYLLHEQKDGTYDNLLDFMMEDHDKANYVRSNTVSTQ